MRSFFSTAVAATALFISNSPTSQARDRFFDELAAQEIGASLGRQLGDVARTMGELRQQTGQLSQKLQAARQRYWATYPDGADLEAAKAAFGELLLAKDVTCLNYQLMPGTELIAGQIDGGIPEMAEADFSVWKDAVVRKMGREFDPFAMPQRLLQAVAASKEQYEVYRRSRDYAELEKAHPKIPAQQYARLLILNNDARGSMDAAVAEYSSLVRLFGEDRVLKAAESVLKARRDSEGFVLPAEWPQFKILPTTGVISGPDGGRSRDRSPVPDDLMVVSGARFPHTLFWNTLMQGEPQHYAAGLLYRRTWSEVFQELERLVAKHGAKAVFDAARLIREQPKRRFDGGLLNPSAIGVKHENLLKAFHAVLAPAEQPAPLEKLVMPDFPLGSTLGQPPSQYVQVSQSSTPAPAASDRTVRVACVNMARIFRALRTTKADSERREEIVQRLRKKIADLGTASPVDLIFGIGELANAQLSPVVYQKDLPDITDQIASVINADDAGGLQSLTVAGIRVATVNLDALFRSDKRTAQVRARLEQALAAVNAEAKERREIIERDIPPQQRPSAETELQEFLTVRQRQFNEQAMRMKDSILSEFMPKITKLAERENVGLVLDAKWKSSQAVLLAPENVDWVDITPKITAATPGRPSTLASLQASLKDGRADGRSPMPP